MITMRELNTSYINNTANNVTNNGLNEDPLVSSLSLPTNQYVKRCVIIQKDENGYGLRVSGESPVYVDSVREGGAAWRAGVRPGDEIIKVSGTLVTRLHHAEVVRMIQNCGSYVGLTLLGLKTPLTAQNLAAKTIQITAPLPASESTQQAYDETKVDMLRDMIRKEREHMEWLRATKKSQTEISKAEKMIQSLEKKVQTMTFEASPQRHTSMSAENLTSGASSDPTLAAANVNAKKSHSFGQYDTRAPIMTMESDDENEDYTNNNNNNTSNNRRNSSVVTSQSSKAKTSDVNDIPKSVEQLHGHSLQMTRYLLTQDLKPHALLFHTMAGHVFPKVAQSSQASRKSAQRLAWQIACTWLMNDSPLTFADFPADSLDKFATTLESSQSSLDTLFEPFFEVTRDILKEQLESWRHTVSIGLAPPTMATPIEELHAIIDLVLNESTHIRDLELVVDAFISHSNVNNASTLAVVMALLTIGNFVFGCPSKHLLISQDMSKASHPVNPVLKLSIDNSTSNKKHKRHISLPNRSQIPGHVEAGHNFNATHEFTKPIYCSGCLCPIWGTFGLTCAHCQMSVHNWCMKMAASNNPCPGPQSDNQSTETTPPMRTGKKSRRWHSDRYTILDMIKKTVAPNHDIHAPPLISSSTSSDDDEDDDVTTGGALHQLLSTSGDATASKSTTPTPPNTIARSESFKQRRKTTPSYRKRSDPALTTSNTTLANNSQTHDSSTTPGIPGSPTAEWQISSSDDEDDPSQTDAQHTHSAGTGPGTPTTDSVTPQHTIDEDTPPPLPPRPPSEKRKQIRNEILESEERHVEVLKFIHHVFYKPLQKDGLLTADQLSAVFSNTKKLMKVHNKICKTLKAPNKSFEQSICDIFCGTIGYQLEAEASTFCTRHKLNGLDTWRARKKDSRLKNFLDPELRMKGIPDCPLARLSLEDHLASVFQRPLRYQLLFDRLLQATPSDSVEYQLIARALARSRDIGSKVNEETRRAESKQRLSDIKRKTDVVGQNLTLDFTEQNLVHEGPLTWRIAKQKWLDVWLLLTDKILVILTRDSSDKFTLKYHTNPSAKSNLRQQDNKTQHSPIVLLHDLFTRDVATDPTAFFLISTDQDVFYEFAAATPNEKKQWKESILNTTFKANKTTQHVIKLKDLTSQPSVDDDHNKPKDDDLAAELVVPETAVADESNTSALSDDQNNNNANNSVDEVVPPLPDESPPTQPPKQSRIEGIIRYVREDEVRPQLISPNRVTISTENVAEALAVHSPEHRIKEIDEGVRQLLNEKRSILAKMRGIKDQYEWTVVSDMGEHDDVASAAREVTFFDRAMSLVSTLGTSGLSADSYVPLVSLRDQIDALLARLTLSQIDSRAVGGGEGGDQTMYLGANEGSDETAVYF